MRRSLPALIAILLASLSCGPLMGPRAPDRPAAATQWLERAKTSYRNADFDDARDAARKALAVAPSDVDVRELAARIALVRLDYAEVVKLTEGLTASSAHGIRGRAFWYSGDVEHAADELEALLADPKVKDPWARDVAALARRGVGRHPFEMDGGLIGAVEMPRSIDRVALNAAEVVPCELDGERILAVVATGSSEVIVDSNTRHDAAWVSLRFGNVQVNDVPALAEDLAPIARQLGVPIRAMLGVQFLRHAHVTLDRRGDQFVVRRRDASPPPDASRVPLYYVRGGGLMLRASVTAADDGPIPLFVDSTRPFPLFLKDSAWRKAGVDVKTLASLPDSPGIKRGAVPMFRVGGFDLAKMPAIGGMDIGELSALDVDLGGVIGSELLAFFRVTFADEGRFMWIEPDPTLLGRPTDPPPSAAAPPPQGLPSLTRPAPPASRAR